MNLKIWELHPQASKVEYAEKTCSGTANSAGVQWCGPYVNANQTGFWVYSPINVDFIFKNGKFEILSIEDYSDADYKIVSSLIKPQDNSNFDKWIFPNSGRTKTTFGFVEPNVMQIWTGLIFQTQPGWCLQIRSPINFPYSGFNVVEAILETDWLQYDIWMNICVTEHNVPISIKKDFPLAHIVPIRRESFKAEWNIEREIINRNTQEAEDVFKYWINYNKQKFEFGGKQALSENLTKDSTTYFKEKSRLIGKNMEPYQDIKKNDTNQSKCPFAHMHRDFNDLNEIKKEKAKVQYESVENNFIFERFFKKS
jgi:hypothetical protein